MQTAAATIQKLLTGSPPVRATAARHTAPNTAKAAQRVIEACFFISRRATLLRQCLHRTELSRCLRAVPRCPDAARYRSRSGAPALAVPRLLHDRGIETEQASRLRKFQW